jgi:hypothetical protein
MVPFLESLTRVKYRSRSVKTLLGASWGRRKARLFEFYVDIDGKEGRKCI